MKYLVILFVVMLLMYITTTPDWLYRSGEKKKEDISDLKKSLTYWSGPCDNNCDNCQGKPQCDYMLERCYDKDRYKKNRRKLW